MSMSWVRGRRLSTITAPGQAYSYSYNDSGVRTSKTVNGTTTTFTLAGTRILKQTSGNTTIEFIYDEAGQAIGFKTGGTTYYYVFNLQGDVTGIVTSAGTQVVTYTYDAWGRPLSTTGSQASTIGVQNPLRYRGYYYDTETGFYYLNSRYYDPVVGRFISEDGALSTGQGYNGLNMFAYCLNNPINRVDYNGHSSISIFEIVINGVYAALEATGTGVQVAYAKARSFIDDHIIVRTYNKSVIFETHFDPIIGNVSYTKTTLTSEEKEPKPFYFFTDQYSDKSRSYGFGLNGWKKLVLELSYKSSRDVAVDIHITPRFHWEWQIGFSGMGGTVGYVNGNQTYDISSTVGWGTILASLGTVLSIEGFWYIFILLYNLPVFEPQYAY